MIVAMLVAKKTNIPAKLGKSTLPIYILHLAFISRANKLCGENILGAVIATIITTIILFAALNMGLYIAKKIKLDKLYCVLTGMRK